MFIREETCTGSRNGFNVNSSARFPAVSRGTQPLIERAVLAMGRSKLFQTGRSDRRSAGSRGNPVSAIGLAKRQTPRNNIYSVENKLAQVLRAAISSAKRDTVAIAKRYRARGQRKERSIGRKSKDHRLEASPWRVSRPLEHPRTLEMKKLPLLEATLDALVAPSCDPLVALLTEGVTNRNRCHRPGDQQPSTRSITRDHPIHF